MMRCDMCGADDKLYKARIEGAVLNVCRKCSRYGKVLGEVREQIIDIDESRSGMRSGAAARAMNKEEENEVILVIVSDFSKQIRKKREELGLNQKEFAKRMSEKESVVHKLENGSLEPSVDLAQKLERMFGLKLIEEYKEQKEDKPEFEGDNKSREMTIADMIKIKKRR